MPETPRSPASGPDDQGPPTSLQRRRLLIAGAFGAASVLTLRGIPRDVAAARSTPRKAPPETPTTTKARTEPPALEGAPAQPGPQHTYDVILAGGRVIDPDSGFDGTLDVGIDGGTITGFGPTVTHARNTIDATGKVVSPGFIDILSYEPNSRGAWYKIADGVTTNLGMHGMQQGWWAQDFFAKYAAGCPVNYGGAFSDHWVRWNKLGLNVGDTATPAQISQLADLCTEQLHQGWIGVNLEPEYTPGVNFAEMLALAKVAQRAGVPCLIHGRYSSHDEETKTVPEIIKLGEQSGAAVHVDHLTSTGGTWHIDAALDEIDAATAAGHDVSFGLYPYDYWATYAGSTRFGPGWQQRFRISYHDLQIAGTPERLNSSSFLAARSDNALTVAYAIPESSVRKAMLHPKSLIGSDAIIDTGDNHPRAAGTFCRVLRVWVREKQALTLVEALAKMTIFPARRLEGASPPLRHKGRIQRGADADVCVFDPETVTDRATVAQPAEYSTGIDWVLLGGAVVKNPQGLQRDQVHGKPIRFEPA